MKRNQEIYLLASNLSTIEKHSLKIQKRTEALFGIVKFGGFILDKGKVLKYLYFLF